MIKSIYFWVLTIVFLAVAGIVLTKIIPPAISDFSTSKASIKELEGKITQEKSFAATVTSLHQNQTDLANFYGLAQEALPDKPDGEELMLQLDGMLTGLGLTNATTTVPLGNGVVSTSESGDKLSIIVAGNYDYAQVRELITGLQNLIRWNKITDFDISQNGDSAHFSLTFNTFYKVGKVKTFSGTSNLLDQAKTLFANYHSYTTRPDVNAEGSYGRDNPFNVPK